VEEFRVQDFFYPRDLIRTYFRLRRSEQWTPTRMRAYQAERLARLIRHCAAEVPYYEHAFAECGIDAGSINPDTALAALRRLPVLDKDTLRDAAESFTARNAARYRPRAIHTSGTTGTPLTVYWDRGSNVMEFCCIQRLWRWAGFRIGQPFLDIRSRLFTGDEKHLVQADSITYLRNPKPNAVEFNVDLIDEDNVGRYYQVLLRYRPTLVRGHPQAIQQLVTLLAKQGLDAWQPKAVTTASETLYPFQRQEIERAWQVPILDSYGLKEHNVFIAQCARGGYHISPEYGICEILDADDEPVGPGEEGWIVATGLHNYAQPLLRYHTRDRAVQGSGNSCPCGRTLPTVDRIVGRIDDCIHSPDGRRYSGMHFAFFGRRGIQKARLTQRTLDTVTVELVTTSAFDESERAALLDALDRKVDHSIAFELSHVDRIEQKTPGKFKFVVSCVDAPVRTHTDNRRVAKHD
jgi:phenylacetate-CoA ligase